MKTITENDYPVESSWSLKIPVAFIAIIFLFTAFLGLILLPIGIFLNNFNEAKITFLVATGILVAVMVGIGFLSTVVAVLSRNNFHYSVEKEFIIFHQGIISKQQKNLPYGVIQDLIVVQDITDRLFGLASITLENASFGGGQINPRDGHKKKLIGFESNVAVIPGLTLKNAELLKETILSKMKEYYSLNRRSGL